MKREAAAAFIAFVVTFALVPLIRHLCRRWQIFDRPGALKIHAKPIPRLGGVAIFLGVLVGIVASNPHNFASHRQFFAAMSVIWVAGLIDDLRGLSPAWRLGAQLLSAFLLWQGGWHIWPAVTPTTQMVLLCALLILFVNSFNFLDGSDGLATGVSFVIAASYLAMPRTAMTPLGFSVALCMATASLAFLAFNRHRASMFLGDSGSTLLGFLAAFIGLTFVRITGRPGYSLVPAFTIAALPICDALRVIIKRVALGTSPISGDRNHFYDSLLANGWTPQGVAVISWVAVAFCGAISVFIVRLHAAIGWSLVAFVAAAAWINLATMLRGKRFAADCEPARTRSDCCVLVRDGKRSESGRQEGGKF